MAIRCEPRPGLDAKAGSLGVADLSAGAGVAVFTLPDGTCLAVQVEDLPGMSGLPETRLPAEEDVPVPARRPV